jgi:uncharacterized membrane protein YfcA
MIPLLLYLPPLFGLPAIDVKAATGIATVQVLFATLLGTLAHHRYGRVDLQLILWVAPSMTAASMLAALLSSELPGQALLGVFAAVATIAAATMWPSALAVDAADRRVWAGEFSRPLATLVGAFVGGVVGLTGAGTFLLAPVFLQVLHVPTRLTIGSALGVAVLAALAATLGKAATGLVSGDLALAVLLGTAPGIYLGTRLSHRLEPGLLRRMLTVLITLVAIRTWWDFLH